jgi:hypothetical protein
MTDDAQEQPKNNVGGITGKGFTPGRSGNPGGRPRGSKSLRNLLIEALRKKTKDAKGNEREYYDLLVEAIVLNAAKGNAALVKLIFDYHEGPPVQKHELAGAGGGPLIPGHLVTGLDNGTRTLLRELRGRLPRTGSETRPPEVVDVEAVAELPAGRSEGDQ